MGVAMKMTRDALLAVADEITEELICCDVYERDKGTDRAGKEHDICFWSGAARAIVLEHAARLMPKEETVPEGLCDNREKHKQHLHQSLKYGGTFWCHADQSKRPPSVPRPRRRVADGSNEEESHGDTG